jgi:AraC-like DNA-binding protein
MARKTAATLPLSGETEWLAQVREVRHPLDPSHPLRVTHRRINSGPRLPQPTVPYPERHPFCEFNFAIEGSGEVFIGMEKVMREAGDLALIGPGIPHYGTIWTYPNDGIVVHFLPILLFEMSPNDGARILARFTASQPISKRIVRPPKSLQENFAAQFESIADEFDHPKFGSELSMRTRLMDALVALIRWEESVGKALPYQPAASSWDRVEKILNFIYHHYTEPLYIEQIAREVGLSTKGLHRLFRSTFGMSCIHYLGAYRISHATSLLALPGARVTEVSAAVGFETLSHFNAAFRRSRGMSPSEYIRSNKTP